MAPDPSEATALGTGAGADPLEPIDLGEPVATESLPAQWPEAMPLPANTTVTRLEVPDSGLPYVEATHAAPAQDVLDWYVAQTADRGFVVIDRVRLGPSARIRLARERERWLVVAALRRDEQGAPTTWINIRRMSNEQPLNERVDGGANDRCEVQLDPTSPRPPVTCRLVAGPPLEGLPAEAAPADAAWNGRETGLLYLSGQTLELVIGRDDRAQRGPSALLDIELPDPTTSFPQLLAGSDDLWLVSWINGDPPERRVAPYDSELTRTDRYLRLSQQLGRLGEAGFAPIIHRDRHPELATAWTEDLNGHLAFRIAGLKRDADRVRRSGQFPVGGELVLGPRLVSDGDTRLALLWGAEDGVWIRPVGTDGLPDGRERRLEPGQPTWLRAVFGDESYWVIWGRGDRGFWVRASLEGCLGGARGSLGGRPEGAWSHPLGPLVQVRRGDRVVLLRLGDDGDRLPAGNRADELGSSRLTVEWSDFEPADEGLRGVVQLPTGFHPAAWVCE